MFLYRVRKSFFNILIRPFTMFYAEQNTVKVLLIYFIMIQASFNIYLNSFSFFINIYSRVIFKHNLYENLYMCLYSLI